MIRPLAASLLLALLATGVPAQVASGLTDPNVATKKELLALPGITEAIAEKLIEERPFADVVALDTFLTRATLDDEARKKFYGKAFIHVDLNRASDPELKLIPGVGKRMAHEFEEYRPWKNWKHFEKEIGKYVKPDEVARLKQYCFIPLDLNQASEADFMTIPGVGKRMAHEFEEYRPWKSKTHFEKEIGKYVDQKQVARFWRYMIINR